MSDDANNADSSKLIQQALESVERLEQEGDDDLEANSVEILRPSEAPPSGDPSDEGATPPDPELEREFEGMGERSLEGAAVGNGGEAAEEDEVFLEEEEPPKKQGKSPEAAMLEAMIAAKNEAVGVLEQTQREAKSLQERLLRVSADYENFKKRQAREKEEAVKFANERLLKELLPVIDNMDRAMEVAKKSAEEPDGGGGVKGVVEGVEMVFKQLGDTFARFGIEPFSALGEPFDPARHEAVAQREDESAAPNTVIEEYQRGYLLHGRLVRPAMVVVSAGAPPAQDSDGDVGERE